MWWWAPLGCVGGCRWCAPLPLGGNYSEGNPRFGSSGPDDGDFRVVLPPMGIVLEQWFTGVANMWSGVTSTTLKMVGLSGVEQSSLSVGRGLIDVRRLVSLFVVVVMSTANGTGRIFA